MIDSGPPARPHAPRLLSLCCWFLISGAGCNDELPVPSSYARDASVYFPIEIGRYWVYYDADDNFLTLELTHSTVVSGTEVMVMSWTQDWDPIHGEEPSPIYEQYFTLDQDDGIRLHGWRDYLSRTSASYVPGVIFAGTAMELDVPLVTSTAENGILTDFVSTFVGEGMVRTWFGDFPDAIAVTFGAYSDVQERHLLAHEIGMVKFDREGIRWQLYDYGWRLMISTWAGPAKLAGESAPPEAPLRPRHASRR